MRLFDILGEAVLSDQARYDACCKVLVEVDVVVESEGREIQVATSLLRVPARSSMRAPTTIDGLAGGGGPGARKAVAIASSALGRLLVTLLSAFAALRVLALVGSRFSSTYTPDSLRECAIWHLSDRWMTWLRKWQQGVLVVVNSQQELRSLEVNLPIHHGVFRRQFGEINTTGMMTLKAWQPPGTRAHWRTGIRRKPKDVEEMMVGLWTPAGIT